METLGAGDRSAMRKQARESENLKIGLTQRAATLLREKSGVIHQASARCQTRSHPGWFRCFLNAHREWRIPIPRIILRVLMGGALLWLMLRV